MTGKAKRRSPIARTKTWLGIFVALLIGAVAIAAWRLGGGARSSARGLAPRAPVLFDDARACPRTDGVRSLARKLESWARFSADRYPYDPSDGVQAVRQYQEARDCYSLAGSRVDAARAGSAAGRLAARIRTDYAAARMNLTRALQSKRWAVAMTEVHRLLLLTEHLGEHDYVAWLKRTLGHVTARANVAP